MIQGGQGTNATITKTLLRIEGASVLSSLSICTCPIKWHTKAAQTKGDSVPQMLLPFLKRLNCSGFAFALNRDPQKLYAPATFVELQTRRKKQSSPESSPPRACPYLLCIDPAASTHEQKPRPSQTKRPMALLCARKNAAGKTKLTTRRKQDEITPKNVK